jgi:hypothetical protein
VWLVAILLVLRRIADRRELEDAILGADPRRALDDDVRAHPRAGPISTPEPMTV